MSADSLGETSEPRPLRLRAGGRPWVELLYVAERDRLYVFPSSAAPGWSSLALRLGQAEVQLPGGPQGLFGVRLETDPERRDRARALFETKYGRARWTRYFSEAPRVIVLDPAPDPTPPSSERRVRDEFEAIAPSYWAGIDRDPVERYLKSRSIAWLERELAGMDPVLEIGCGPGIETIPLLRAGHRITAVDLSPAMLAQVAQRAAGIGAADRLIGRSGSLATLDRDLRDLPRGSFRGAYSTFGAPNLEPDLGAATPELARLLAPGAPLLLGVLNRWGVMPLIYEGLRGGVRPVRARLRRPIPAEEIRYPLDVWSWTPAEHDQALRPYFERVAAEPVSILAPPFRADRWIARSTARGHRAARWLDGRLRALPGAALGCEWLFLKYRRTELDVGG